MPKSFSNLFCIGNTRRRSASARPALSLKIRAGALNALGDDLPFLEDLLPQQMKDSIPPRIMSIVSEDGSVEEVEVILAFEFKDTKKEYVVYTKHETDRDGNTTIYVSHVDRTTGEPRLMGVEDEQEWSRVREVLRSVARSDDSQPYDPQPYYDENGKEII